MSNIVELFTRPGETLLDIEADTVLQEAINSNLEHVLVIGRHGNGEYYFASTTSDIGNCLVWMERCKQQLLDNEND